MQTSPNTAMAAAPGTNYSGLANLMAMQGTGGDNTLVHMSKSELPYLNNLARAAGHPQGLPVNPKTGLPEANILKTILPVAGAILGGMFFPPSLLGLGAGSALATGVGAGLGSFAGSMFAGKSFKDAAIGGLLSGGLSGLSAGMFGGQSLMGDPATLATTGAAGPGIVGPSLDAFQGGAGVVEGAQLGAVGLPEGGMGSYASGAGFNPSMAVPNSAFAPTPFGPSSTPMFADTTAISGGDGGYGLAKDSLRNFSYNPSGMGTPTPANYQKIGMGASTNIPSQAFKNIDARIAASEAAPVGMSNLANPAGAFTTYPPDLAQQLPNSGMGSINTTPAPVPTKDAIASAYRDKYDLSKDFTGDSLREGYKPNVKDLKGIQGMSEPSYFSSVQGYNPEGPLTRMDFLKTQFKPMATQAGVMTGIDALTGQGAFEPIDYSGYPTGEENRPSPLALKGLKFESERTGAFPTTEEQALAFAQPGGVPRQRFFNQRFTIPARTGGGIAALIR